MDLSRKTRDFGLVAILLASVLVPGESLGQVAPASAARGDLENFTFNYNRSPQHFDPGSYSSGEQNTVQYPVFDRLLTTDDAGKVYPGLADSWEYSDDGLRFTMHLKKGASYQDGKPFDAISVKLNIMRSKTEKGSTQAVLLRSVDAIDVVDDHTVVLKLNRRDSTLPFIFADQCGMMISPDAFAHVAVKPVGAGPFKLVDYVSGQYAAYQKWDGYWDAANIHVKNLRINFTVDPTTAFNSLQSGAADAAYISGQDAKSAAQMGLMVDAHPTTAVYRYYINPKKFKPFADKRVREAMNDAIDRKAIAESLYAGYAEPAAQFFPQTSPYYNSDLPKFEFNPDRARKLLAEAGYPNGFTFISGATTSDVGAYVAVQAMLANVGINVQFRVQPSAEAGSSYFNGQTDALIATWGGRLDPLATLQLTTGNGVQNPGSLNTPKFLSLLDETLATSDPAKRIDLIRALDTETSGEALDIPIVLPSSIIAYRKGLGGMPSSSWSDRALDFRNVYATHP